MRQYVIRQSHGDGSYTLRAEFFGTPSDARIFAKTFGADCFAVHVRPYA